MFPCALGTFSIKESVFPCTLGTFSIKDYLLVFRYDSYNAVERVFPCALGTFSIKRECFLVLWVRLVSKRECIY